MNKLDLYWEEAFVGHLSLDSKQRFVFQYHLEFLQTKNATPISITLPLRSEAYEEDTSRPFFANLLPEANIRTAITQKLGLSEENEFGLLEAIGGECAGALSLWPTGTKPSQKGSYQPVSHSELENWVNNISTRPLLLGPETQAAVRLSLAGAQSKIPLYMKGEELFLPQVCFSSSHILKPPMPGFKGSVTNEAFCMALATQMKLGVADSFVLPRKIPSKIPRKIPCKLPFYVTKRFDRNIVEQTVKRLHQEDFCQALALLPQNKYESEGGPSLTDCFRLLENQSSQPLQDRFRLLKWVIFNQLIGNTDAHAKNLSLLFIEGEVILAPFYDLMCTRIYPKLTENAAMNIGGEKRLDWIWQRHWEQLSHDIGIKPKLVIETVKEFAAKIPKEALVIKNQFKEHGWAHPVLDQICELITLRCSKTFKRI